MRTDDEARLALAAQPFPANPWVQVTDDVILIKAGYSETLQRMLRWVPKAQWRADLRCWSVPLAGAELVRSVLPEISRLAEAMQEEPSAASADQPGPAETAEDAQARSWFRDAARLLYGSDWQRDTARALGRDEAALACWLAGEGVAEAPPEQLLDEMLALMRRRSLEMLSAADSLEARILRRAQGIR
jgi:hypothetical protein